MIIATRTLILDAAGKPRTVELTFAAPELREGSWYCRVTIGWPENAQSHDVGGADAVQALFCALQFASMSIYNSDYHAAGQLIWAHRGMGYGLPLISGMRDLAIGTDKAQAL